MRYGAGELMWNAYVAVPWLVTTLISDFSSGLAPTSLSSPGIEEDYVGRGGIRGVERNFLIVDVDLFRATEIMANEDDYILWVCFGEQAVGLFGSIVRTPVITG